MEMLPILTLEDLYDLKVFPTNSQSVPRASCSMCIQMVLQPPLRCPRAFVVSERLHLPRTFSHTFSLILALALFLG